MYNNITIEHSGFTHRPIYFFSRWNGDFNKETHRNKKKCIICMKPAQISELTTPKDEESLGSLLNAAKLHMHLLGEWTQMHWRMCSGRLWERQKVRTWSEFRWRQQWWYRCVILLKDVDYFFYFFFLYLWYYRKNGWIHNYIAVTVAFNTMYSVSVLIVLLVMSYLHSSFLLPNPIHELIMMITCLYGCSGQL